MDQVAKDAKYNRYSIIGFLTGLWAGYPYAKNFGMMIVFGFSGLGLAGTIAYTEITYFRS